MLVFSLIFSDDTKSFLLFVIWQKSQTISSIDFSMSYKKGSNIKSLMKQYIFVHLGPTYGLKRPHMFSRLKSKAQGNKQD